MLSQFKWYRWLRGGRWIRLGSHLWVKLHVSCTGQVDEDYTQAKNCGWPKLSGTHAATPAAPMTQEKAIEVVSTWLANSVTTGNIKAAESSAQFAPQALPDQGIETSLNDLGIPTPRQPIILQGTENYANDSIAQPSAYSVTTVQPKCRHCGSLIGQAELDKNECNICHGQFVELVVDTEPEPPTRCGHCGRNMTSQGPGLVCLPCYSDQDLQASTRIYDRWLDTAHRYAAAHKKVPVVLDVEIYEYYDKPVKITSVNVYPGHTEVTVEGRFGDVAETDLDDLSLRALKFKHAETLVPCCHIRVSEDKQEIDPAFRFAASLSLNRGNRYTCGRSAEEVVQQLKRRYPETADLPVVNDE